MLKHTLSSVLTVVLSSTIALAGGRDHGAGNGEDNKNLREALVQYIENEDMNLKASLVNYLKTLRANGAAKDEAGPRGTLLNLIDRGIALDIKMSRYETRAGCREQNFAGSTEVASASTRIGAAGSVICFDVDHLLEQVKSLSLEDAKIRVAALALHEHVHHFQDANTDIERNEAEAYSVAAYVLHTAKFVQVPLLKWSSEGKRVSQIALPTKACYSSSGLTGLYEKGLVGPSYTFRINVRELSGAQVTSAIRDIENVFSDHYGNGYRKGYKDGQGNLQGRVNADGWMRFTYNFGGLFTGSTVPLEAELIGKLLTKYAGTVTATCGYEKDEK